MFVLIPAAAAASNIRQCQHAASCVVLSPPTVGWPSGILHRAFTSPGFAPFRTASHAVSWLQQNAFFGFIVVSCSSTGPRPSLPVSAAGASLRSGRYPLRHFYPNIQQSASIRPHLAFRISGSSDLRSAAALQTFHILLLIHCSRVALSGSPSHLSGGLPASGRPRFSKIRVHVSFTQLQTLLHTSPAGRCATRVPGACGALLPANGSMFELARRLPLASKVKPAHRTWNVATIHAISSVHNDIKGKRYAIPSFPEDALVCPFHALLPRGVHPYSCVFSVEYYSLMVPITVISFIRPVGL